MLMRSSSTPILGSLHHQHQHHPLTPFTCHLSDDHPRSSTIRRSSSESNLHSLLPDNDSQVHPLPHLHLHPHPLPPLPHLHPHPLPPSSSRHLETIPSFSVYHADRAEDPNVKVEQEFEEELDGMPPLCISRGFSFQKHNVGHANNGRMGSPLFLARGLGIDRIGPGLMNPGDFDGSGGGEHSDIEGYYKRTIEEDPSNPVFLRNYAQFLYQTKGDLQRAEEYYSRAILLDPGDGELLSQYAKLIWELHGDEERASSYFERAVQAAPQDSHVLASYASFLWEAEDDDSGGGVWEAEDDDSGGGVGDGQLQDYAGSHHYGVLTSAA